MNLPMSSKQNVNKNKKVIISSIIILSLLVIGSSLIIKNNKKDSKVETVSNPTSTTDNSSSKPSDVAVDTKPAESSYSTQNQNTTLFENSSPVFSFRYPKDMGGINLNIQNNNTPELMSQGFKGNVIYGQASDSEFKFRTASIGAIVPGNDEVLAVFSSQGYGSNYSIEMNNQIESLSTYPGFNTGKTDAGHEYVIINDPSDSSAYIAVINLDSASGYKSIGFYSKDLEILQTILKSLVLG
jgi:hypothetical protein